MGNPDGSSILHNVLCLRGDEEDVLPTVTKLLELGCGDPMVRDEQGRTALHILVANDTGQHLNDCIDLLLSFVDESERTAYVNATDADGKSALYHAAVHYSSVSRVRRLLDLHADPFVGNPDGLSILHHVARDGKAANKDDFLYTFTRLLELGCGDPMARDGWGMTVLHMLVTSDGGCCVNDCIDVLLSFVDESERTAYVNATDAEGNSALFHASLHGSVPIVRKLLDLQADPFVGNPDGYFGEFGS